MLKYSIKYHAEPKLQGLFESFCRINRPRPTEEGGRAKQREVLVAALRARRLQPMSSRAPGAVRWFRLVRLRPRTSGRRWFPGGPGRTPRLGSTGQTKC